MILSDLVRPEDLNAALTLGLVSARTSDDGALTIYNYTDSAMYTPGAWDNPAVRQCRGVIVDASGQVIARPWAKFFNHGQTEAGVLDLAAPVEVTDKMDGSLGVLYLDAAGRPSVATRGSFTSDQAIHATAVLRERYGMTRIDQTLTILVEIIYPENRIVCDYGDLDDLVLLGSVGIETGHYFGPEVTRHATGWLGPVTTTMPYRSLLDALAAPPRPGAEGMCVRYLDRPQIVKIKQEDYVALHRIVTGLSERTVWETMCARKPHTDLLDGLPDELHPWVVSVWDRIAGEAEQILGAAGAAYTDVVETLGPEGTWTRGDFAAQAKARPPLTPYLFQMLDGRDTYPAILKTLRPHGDTRARARSEAIA